ncbi:T9SS type A sorting domain-containing protein [Flavitalea flava]
MKRKLYTFLVLILSAGGLMAQAPGGVPTLLKMWVRSTSGTSLTGSNLTTWTYVNDATKSFTAALADAPVFTNSVINFNPAAAFTGAQFMDGPTGANAPVTVNNSDYSAFVVWQSTTIGAFQRIWEQRSSSAVDIDAFAISTNNTSSGSTGLYGDEYALSPFTQGLQKSYTQNAWNISQINLLNQPSSDLEILDAQTYNLGAPGVFVLSTTDVSTPPSGGDRRKLSDQYNRMGANWDGAQPLNGAIAEIIVYNRSISGTERAQIFSYLALKYGVNLGTNLVNSTGTTIWDATANASFNNAVFGIGQDNNGGLNVTQSNSIVTGSGDGTGQSAQGNVILSNPSAPVDGGFLLIGNDGNSFTETTTGAPPAAPGIGIMGRTWKVQETGTVGTVDLSIDYTGLSPAGTPGDASKFRLVVSPSGGTDFSGTTTIYSPTSFSNANQVANYTGVMLNDGATLTFGSTATPLPVTWKSFTGTLSNGKINLNWTIDNNKEGKVFEVEHSADGVHFTNVGSVPNNPSVKSYSFVYSPDATDTKHYFRIHEVDLDGQAIYSKIISVASRTDDFTLRVLSNPVINNSVELEINAGRSGNATIEVWSATGTRIAARQQYISNGTTPVSIPLSNAAAGNYIVRFRLGDTIVNQKIVKH